MAHEMFRCGVPSVNSHRSPFAGRKLNIFEDPTRLATCPASRCWCRRPAYSVHQALRGAERAKPNATASVLGPTRSIRTAPKPFETIIWQYGDAQAEAGTFNYIGNNIFQRPHTGLNQTVLRGEWGFQGPGNRLSAPTTHLTADQAAAPTQCWPPPKLPNHTVDHSATPPLRPCVRLHILYTAVNSYSYADGSQPIRCRWKVSGRSWSAGAGRHLVGPEHCYRCLSRRKAAAAGSSSPSPPAKT